MKTFENTDGELLTIKLDQYASEGLAVQLRDSAGLPYATISMWLDQTPELPKDQFFVKAYSENEQIVGRMLTLGILKIVGKGKEGDPIGTLCL
jgi:hypothetical protein